MDPGSRDSDTRNADRVPPFDSDRSLARRTGSPPVDRTAISSSVATTEWRPEFRANARSVGPWPDLGPTLD